MDINNLVVEVTRNCNMACAHCLRGDTQNMFLKHAKIDSLLRQVDSIGTVTFSGGEPSLHTEAIEYFLRVCDLKEIPIERFYIATNGMEIDEAFVIACLKLFAYSDDKEMCLVQVSNDIYHSSEGNYDTELLDGLSFFNRRSTEENYNYNHNRALINEGRAKEYFPDAGSANMEDSYSIENRYEFDEAQIYLNCNGDIINGCNWSYESQEDHVICKVNALSKFYENLEE